MLRPRKRITKREIKEDALVTAYFRVQKFIRKYNRQLNIGFVIVVLIGVVSVLMVRSKKKAELAASGKLGIAEQFYYAPDYGRAIDELIQIVNTYSGTNAAGKAAFFLANVYFATEDYGNAERYYRMYLDDYSNSTLFSASSLAGIAACLESQNRYAEAARLYEKAGGKYPDFFEAPFFLKDAGRCYGMAGNREKSKEMYQYIIERYPESSLRHEVAFLSESLELVE